MQRPNDSTSFTQPTIAIIGAGIIGLTCAAELVGSGYNKITIYAESTSPYTTSDVAAATCFTQKSYLEPENSWYQNNLVKLKKLLSVVSSGVSEMNYMELSRDNAMETDEYKCVRSTSILLVNSKYHLQFLMDILDDKKIPINKKHISHIQELTEHYDVIINCSGLGARKLCNDQDVYPVRGQLVILSKPRELKSCIAELAEDLTYIIPREDECIVGGTEELNSWNLEPNDETTHRIVERAQRLYPLLKNEKILKVKVGLRPNRKRIRLEMEKINNSFVIHNYGHGGEGYSFAWGCAVAVRDILKKEYT